MNSKLTRVFAVLTMTLAAAAAYAQDKLSDYRLGPGDSIKVQVYQSPDLTLEARVSESGVINYPLVGRINIGGLTIPEAESRIAEAPKKKPVLKSPHGKKKNPPGRGSQGGAPGRG